MIKHECPTKVDRSGITKHINDIFESGELEELSNVQKMHISSTKPTIWATQAQMAELFKQLEAYLHWLKEETEALRFYNSSMEQWCRDHGWTEAELERERQSNHKKTASVTIVMSPTLRSSLEKIAQRHRVTIAAWARDVLHHAALEYYPESSE